MKVKQFGKLNLLLAVVLILAAAWKVLLLGMDVLPFNADEAVVGLMARNILEGEIPIFFYGQAYMGSLDAFLVAAGFVAFGSQVWVIRLVQILLYLGTIYTTFLLGRRIEVLGKQEEGDNHNLKLKGVRSGLIAGLLLAIPSVNVTLYTTVSLGGYGEALFIGNLIVLMGLKLLEVEPTQQRMINYLAWAIISGLGLWANGLTLIYSLPLGLMLLWRAGKRIKATGWGLFWRILCILLIGVLIGSLPWWIYAIQNGLDHLVMELSGSAVSVEPGSWFQRVIGHLQNLFLLGGTVIFGFRPPWEVRWLVLPMLPFVLVFWAAVVFVWARGVSRKYPAYSLYRAWMGVALTLFGGFIFTSFGVDPSGRYFIPLAVPLALAAAETIQIISERVRWQALLVCLVMVYHAWGTIDCASRYPPGITTQFDLTTSVDQRKMSELIDFLQANGEIRGYTNYWVAYPLAFRSNEEVIFVPRLPYHQDMRYSERDDRYSPYTEMVNTSERVAYVTSNTPKLDNYLRNEFERSGVSWLETSIGDFHVFYALSKAVRPTDIGLGETFAP